MKKILILAGDFVEDYELMVPYQALESIGFHVDVVCPDKKVGDVIATAVHDFIGFQTYAELRGHNFVITKNFEDVKLTEYAGLFIPGGRSPEYLRLNAKVLDYTRYFFANNLPVAAVCHGIQILTAAKVVTGRTMSCYPAVAPEISLGGGTYKDIAPAEAITEGNLVTSPAWPGHQALLAQFYKLLGVKITIE